MKKFVLLICFHLIVLIALMFIDEPFFTWYWDDVFMWSRRGQADKIAMVHARPGETVDVAIQTNALSAFTEEITPDRKTRIEVYEVSRKRLSWGQKRVFFLLHNDFWAFFEQFGLVWAGVLICIFLWEYHPEYRRYIAVFLAASIVTAIIVAVSKHTTGKLRPGLTEGKVTFLPFLEGWGRGDNICFPSGHTTQAFVLATFMACLYPRLRVFYYVVAAITGASRIVTTAHWPSDVYGGAILGYGVTKGTYLLFERWWPVMGEWLSGHAPRVHALLTPVSGAADSPGVTDAT